MNTRDQIQFALLREDKESIARLLQRDPPLTQFDGGCNLAHLAAVSGSPSIIRLVRSLIGDAWDALILQKNYAGMTPCDIVIEIGRHDLLEVIDESHPLLRANAPKEAKPKPIHPYANLSIEEEQLQTRLDAAGRKHRVKLNQNANGKPFQSN